MAAKMEILDPSTLSAATSTVSFDPKTETVILPGGVVSVAGITVVTGGAELSCGSCMLAFGFWGTLIGFSCISVGVWDQVTNRANGGTSHLLGLGLVILALCFLVVGGVVTYYILTKTKRAKRRQEREEGKEVLVEESERVIKKVTV